jgi:hypothetical protein
VVSKLGNDVGKLAHQKVRGPKSVEPERKAEQAREIPSTPAAMPGVSKEVSDNLRAPAPEDKKSSVHARIAQLGKKSGAAVQHQVERFLENPAVQTVGHGIADVSAKGVNLSAQGLDVLVSTIGTGADFAADGIMAGGEKLDDLADVGRAKLKGAAENLREKSLGMIAEAERLMGDVDNLDESSKAEAQKMWASGQALKAVGERIDHFASSGQEEFKAYFAKGGSAVLKVVSDVFDGMAEVVHKGAKGLAAAVTVTGKFLKWLVGKDTLRSTAISVYGGLRMNAVSQKLNGGVGGGFFFPSFKDADELIASKARVPSKKSDKPPETYADCVVFDWGVSAASPVAGAGWNSRGGAGAGVNLYFIAATFNEMTERVFIGIPGVWGVTLGRDRERGSEVNFGNGVGLVGGPKLGAYATYGVAVHTPLLDPVNKYVTRPIAKCIVGITKAITGGAKWTYSRITGAHGNRGGPIDPPARNPDGDGDSHPLGE